jgi:hypothetical protein
MVNFRQEIAELLSSDTGLRTGYGPVAFLSCGLIQQLLQHFSWFETYTHLISACIQEAERSFYMTLG